MIDSLMSFDDTLKESNISTLVFEFPRRAQAENLSPELMYSSMFRSLPANGWLTS